MTARDRLEVLLVSLATEVGDAATLTATRDGGWELKPEKSDASRISVDADEGLTDVTISFGRGGRIELIYRQPAPEEALSVAEKIMRGVITGGLSERWKSDSSRRASTPGRWTLWLPDGRRLRGWGNWLLPWAMPWQNAHERHYAPWV